MKLYTQIPISEERSQIDYTSKVLLLGSCFAENIGEKLGYFKFQTLQNPFGIVFHPLAIENLITRAINLDYFGETDIFFHNELWQCFETHSSMSNSDAEEFIQQLNERLDAFSVYLKEATHIVFTYGTSWVYRHIESDSVVANCHKVPNKKFLKELLSVQDISESIESSIALIKSVNRDIIFIETLSPVRHTKDGFVENARSKAHLLTGLHETIEPRNHVHYFPSYELMMDELREYRFYASDMLHLNETAVAIIWERFQVAWVLAETKPLQKQIGQIQSGLAHSSFHPEGVANVQFRKELQQKIVNLQKHISHLTFS